MKSPAPTLRCAIYTRVSTDHGLDQEFNSLDNQREAAEAYVKSQAHEGWRCLPDRYDDGGFSGGSMERPALRALLEEIRAKRIDVVVVYKVDRLTRSLADFAKLVEAFDAHGVSFVSVTQAFNTTTSMGRLTLNVLLSFAQFEREVTGERIRDKIAASKRKGLWMGGVVPLGYKVKDRKLVVDVTEAQTVRLVFERYLALGSLPALQRELREQGIVTRSRTLSSGRVVGGVALTNGPLAHLLRNRVYLGKINHRGQSHPGEHDAIVTTDLFDAVQRRLTENLGARRRAYTHSDALLIGRVFDDRGNPMTPSYAVKQGKRYRYYTSSALIQGRREAAGSIPRVGANEIEAAVIEALRARDADPETSDRDLVHRSVARITIGKDRLEIHLAEEEQSMVLVPWSPQPFRRKRELIVPDRSETDQPIRPMKAQGRARLLKAIAQGRAWLADLTSGTIVGTDALALRERCAERSIRRTLSLAFLSPTIVQAIIAGQLPRNIGVQHLADLPPSWRDQQATLGF